MPLSNAILLEVKPSNFSAVREKMDPSSVNPRDHILSLLSSLVINEMASGVTPKVGTPTSSNSLVAQVCATQIRVMTSILAELSVQNTEDPSEVVARVTEKQLENNALYMHIKLLVSDQNTEVIMLRESNIKLREENGALIEQCATLK